MKKVPNLRRRTFAFLLAACMTVPLAGCGGGNGGEESQSASIDTTVAEDPNFDPMAKYDPGITITTVGNISDGMQQYIDKQPDVLTNNIWYNGYKEDLGITIEYEWTTNSTQFSQKLNQQISANDLPDIFYVDANQLKTLVDNDMIADLTDAFDIYATDWTQEIMDMDLRVGLEQSTFDGKLRAIPNIYGSRSGGMMWWVRTDWLENLGLEEPETLDDILNIAEAFAKNDPDMDGQDDTYGMAMTKNVWSWGMGMESIAMGCHAYDGWLDDGSGNAVAGIIQPEVKEALGIVAEMYQNGIIDPEFIVKDDATVSDEVVAGKFGLFSGSDGHAFYPIPDSMKADNAEWKVFPIVDKEGNGVAQMTGGSAGGYYVVSKDCKNPEAIVKLYNYWWDKDPAPSANFDADFHGQPDSNPDNPPQNAYYWAVVQATFPNQNLYIHQQANKYWNEQDESVLDVYWVQDNVTQHQAYLDGDMNFASTWMWSGPEGALSIVDYYNQNDLYFDNMYTGTTVPAQTKYQATLDQLKLETFTKIVMGEAPVDEFDNFVTQWKNLGGDEITKEVNEAIKAQ